MIPALMLLLPWRLTTDSSDDETTLLQAETEEAEERQLGNGAFVPDPEELHKLRQEMDMPSIDHRRIASNVCGCKQDNSKNNQPDLAKLNWRSAQFFQLTLRIIVKQFPDSACRDWHKDRGNFYVLNIYAASRSRSAC